jgi:hypothetical protein
MLYTYDIDRIKFNRIKPIQYIIWVVLPLLLISLLTFLYGYYRGLNLNLDNLSHKEKLVLIEEMDKFNEDKLVDMMKDLGIRFPYIPYAQSKLETGSWKSNLFIENYNLFGMKQATRRVSTAKGSNKGHAYYDTWRESVYDYAFYQCRYLGNIKTEDEYFQYLSATYAEDGKYVDKLKRIIENEKLRERFQ